MGRYELRQRLAVGGMGEIYLAVQSGPDGFSRRCVVKRILEHLTEDPQVVRMFLEEAQLAGQLSHPHIAQIFDFGSHENTYFIAMEYVPGSDLKAIIRQHAQRGAFVPFAVAARIISQAADALHYAHSAIRADGTPLDVIHRDVSPQNILLSRSGMVKLIDFGIAKAASPNRKTSPGVVKGKYGFMSPEQARGQTLDCRSDIYSLGLVLYELLSNRSAIEEAPTPLALDAVAHARFAPVDTHRPDVPSALAKVLQRATALRPEDRYSTAEAMGLDLERYIASSGQGVAPAHLAAILPAMGPLARPTPSPPAAPPDRPETNPGTRARASGARRAWISLACATCLGAGAGLLTRDPAPPAPGLARRVPSVPAPAPPPALAPAPAVAPQGPVERVAAPTAPGARSRPPAPAPLHRVETRQVETPAATPTKGEVAFRVRPYGEIYLGNANIGTTPLKAIALDPGHYSFRIVNPELDRVAIRNVEVRSGERQVLRVNLED